MRRFSFHIALTMAIFAAAANMPARAELVSASNPATIKAIVESTGWPAKLGKDPDGDPLIESANGAVKFIILFRNCDAGAQCKTLRYYLGFSDAKHVTLDRLNEWNRDRRFARAYRDEEGDPILEMDLDLDFKGIPRENVVESFNTWGSLMEAFHQFIFEDLEGAESGAP